MIATSEQTLCAMHRKDWLDKSQVGGGVGIGGEGEGVGEGAREGSRGMCWLVWGWGSKRGGGRGDLAARCTAQPPVRELASQCPPSNSAPPPGTASPVLQLPIKYVGFSLHCPPTNCTAPLLHVPPLCTAAAHQVRGLLHLLPQGGGLPRARHPGHLQVRR